MEFLDFRSEILLRDLGAVPKNANALVSVETLTSKKHPVTRRFAEKYGNIARILPNHYLQSHLSDGWNYDSGGVCAGLRGDVVVSNAWHRIEKVGACYVVTIK